MFDSYLIQRILVLILFCSSSAASAQEVTLIQKMTRADLGFPYTEVTGYSADIDGNYAIVSSQGGGLDTQGQSGIVTIYELDTVNNTWSEIKHLGPSMPVDEGGFGFEVSIEGDYIAIVQFSRIIDEVTLLDRRAAVYIFHKNEGGVNNWGQVKRIESDQAVISDFFGGGLAFSGGNMAIKTRFEVIFYDQDAGGSNNWGEVKRIPLQTFNFTKYQLDMQGDTIVMVDQTSNRIQVHVKNQGGANNWGQIAILDTDDSASNLLHDVAIYDDYIAAAVQGQLYIFKDGGNADWSLVQQIDYPGTLADDQIDLRDGELIVGVFRDSTDGANTGRALVYRLDEVTDLFFLEQTIIPSTIIEGDNFGKSVGISNGNAIVGASSYTPSDYDVNGRTFIFQQDAGGPNNWGEVLAKEEEVNSGFDHQYGLAMDMDGDILIAAARSDQNPDGIRSGTVHISYKDKGGADNWGQVKELSPDDAIDGQGFGNKLAISVDVVAVADTLRNLYIFYKDQGGVANWGQVTKLTYQHIVSSIDVEDGVLVVGVENVPRAYVHYQDVGGTDSWGEVKELTGFFARFGDEVSIAGDDIFVGETPTGGRVWHFQRDLGCPDNWGFREHIRPPEAEEFGRDISTYEDRLVVTDQNRDSSGDVSASVYEKGEDGSYARVKYIENPGSTDFNRFGRTVSLYRDVLVIAAPSFTGVGRVYLYKKDEGGIDNWGLVADIRQLEPFYLDQFGFSLAHDSHNLFVGTVRGDDYGRNSGSIYRYSIKAQPFTTTWTVDSDSDLTIPLQEGIYDFEYVWTLVSDSTVQIVGSHTTSDGDFTTTFVDGGAYTLEISGRFPHFKGYPAAQLVDVTQWGSNAWQSMNGSFKDWTGTSFSAVDIPDLSAVYDFTAAFSGASSFDGDISTWNMETGEVLDSMFFEASAFNQDISKWDVGNVTSMAYMFADADSFDQPIGKWEVSANENFDGMFKNNDVFGQPLGDWQFNPTASFEDVFLDATAFTCESWSETIIGWRLGNENKEDIAIGGPIAEVDSLASIARLELEGKGWTINGNPTNTNCAAPVGKVWLGAIDSSWTEPENWFPSGLPVKGDSIVIPLRTHQPTLSTESPQLASITIGSGVRFYVTDEGVLSINGSLNASAEPVGIKFVGEDPRLINDGTTRIDSTFDAVRYENTFSKTGEVINNGFFETTNTENSSFVGTGVGGKLINQPCAIINIDAKIDTIIGRINNQGLINYFATSYTNNGEYLGEAFRYDPLQLLPTNTSANDNPTYVEIPYNLEFFNIDRDGDGITLCEGDHVDDIFRPFKSEWMFETPTSFVLSPNPDYDYDYFFCLTNMASGKVTCGSYDQNVGDQVIGSDLTQDQELLIVGDFPHMQGHDVATLAALTQWGDIKWKSMESMFEDWPGADLFDADTPDLSEVTTLSKMFKNASNYLGDVQTWDVSNVENMEEMFFGASAFNDQIAGWDVGNVTTMRSMFEDADNFNQPLGDWDISNVTSFTRMFAFNDGMNQNLGRWRFSNSDDLMDMLEGATAFDCDNYSSTLIGWNYGNPNVFVKFLGTSPTLEYDQQGGAAAAELFDKFWLVPGVQIDGDCITSKDKYWKGGFTGFGASPTEWNNSFNWTPFGAPVAGDAVFIPTQEHDPILDKTTPFLKRIEIFSGATVTVTPLGKLRLQD